MKQDGKGNAEFLLYLIEKVSFPVYCASCTSCFNEKQKGNPTVFAFIWCKKLGTILIE